MGRVKASEKAIGKFIRRMPPSSPLFIYKDGDNISFSRAARKMYFPLKRRLWQRSGGVSHLTRPSFLRLAGAAAEAAVGRRDDDLSAMGVNLRIRFDELIKREARVRPVFTGQKTETSLTWKAQKSLLTILAFRCYLKCPSPASRPIPKWFHIRYFNWLGADTSLA